MKLPTYQFLAQMSAALAVVVSLGFVAYELKQARDIALADIYQQRSMMAIELQMSLYTAEQVQTAFAEIRSGNPQLTWAQRDVLESQVDTTFTYFENVHFQNQLGMVTEEEWLSTRELIKGRFRVRCVEDWWNRIDKSTYRSSFVSVVDELLSSMEPPPCPLTPPKQSSQ